MQAGARDYLVTNRLDSYWLPRALGHAIEREPGATATDCFWRAMTR